jgi:hypothetical protein
MARGNTWGVESAGPTSSSGSRASAVALVNWRVFGRRIVAVALSSLSACSVPPPVSQMTTPATHTAEHSGTAVDPFGVRMLYPTKPGGREWFLSAEPSADPAWRPESRSDVFAAESEAGVFHAAGAGPRFSVRSPAGTDWWRNVEMTGYVRYRGPVTGELRPHWEWYARGERHTAQRTDPGQINDGIVAPVGTATWPGYPFAGGALNQRCLATSYHANLYVGGEVHFEKEISWTQGYGEVRGKTQLLALRDLTDRWIGFKFVLRNEAADRFVALEAWVDADASGDWAQVASTEDRGDWSARDPKIDGCGEPPFAFTPTQILTWAGPWATFRTDSTSADYKWLSVREVAALP